MKIMNFIIHNFVKNIWKIKNLCKLIMKDVLGVENVKTPVPWELLQ